MRPHPSIQHPSEYLVPAEGLIAKANDWAAGHLAMAFGLIWTVWLFMTIPLIVLFFPSSVKSVVFYLASGWIQLWALPLFIYVGNKLQQSQNAQSDAQHEAFTHLATEVDEIKKELTVNHPVNP